MRPVALVPSLLLIVTAQPTGAAASRSHTLLQDMTLAAVKAAGVGGTGCSWSARAGGATRFASSDDRAVVRIGGRTLTLVPDRDAVDLAPFTFDRWRGKDVTIRVVETGPSRHRGEAFVSGATLRIVHRGARYAVTGSLVCGM